MKVRLTDQTTKDEEVGTEYVNRLIDSERVQRENSTMIAVLFSNQEWSLASR